MTMQYLERDTLMHRLTPALKIVWFFVSAVLIAVCQDLSCALYMGVLFVILWFATKLHREIFRLFRSLFPYLFMIFFVWVLILIFKENGTLPPIWKYGILCVDWADFTRGIMTLIRVFLMISTFYILILSTNFSEIIAGLHKLHIPYKAAFSVGLVFQAIPIMVSEYETIRDAQRSRGLEVDKGSILTRVKNYGVVLFPLFIRVLNKSQNMTTAMFIYKLDLTGKRKPYKDTKASWRDLVFAVLWMILWAGCIWLFILKPIVI